MRYAAALLLFTSVVIAPLAHGMQDSQPLTVHEWGTFTSVAGVDGASLDWRPLATSDLPSFVYTLSGRREGKGLRGRDGNECKACGHDECGCGKDCAPRESGHCGCCKSCTVAQMRMETPVLYFYADKEMDVSVKVGFPKGLITEWYPQAREVKPILNAKTPFAGVAGGEIDWGTVRILPGAKAKLPVDKGPSHYYAARETDAALVQVCSKRSEEGKASPEVDRFLFYRGVGNFDLPVQAVDRDGSLAVRNTGKDALRHLFVVRVAGKRVAWGYRSTLETGDTWDAKPDCGTSIEPSVVKALRECGLFEREATAMVKTWRDSWFEEDGVRVFYVLPSRVTDELLPLTISPKPANLVRVLVGRCEVLTPERTRDMERIVSVLASESFDEREEAMRRLKSYGRFAEPLLKQVIAASKDPEIRTRCESLLKLDY